MKQFPKRLAALLIALTLIVGLFPVMSFAVSEDAAQPEQAEPFYGYRATPHAASHALTDAYLRGEGERVNYFNPGQPVKDLPTKYDSRDYGYITSVKNQNPYGSCWAHAAMASVESYMIKHEVPVGTGAAATINLNLSETQHCFFTFAGAYDVEGMIEGDKATLTGGDSCLDNGGNGELSAYTLMRWNGAPDETISALAYSNASTVAYSGLDSQYAYQYNDCHVQNSVWIPGTNVEAVKQAIMEYGAGNISYYEGGQGSYICNIPTTETYSNHAITVVGWDDSIAVSKFSPNKPSRPGAWICKNSWGTYQFDNGYCYISYEDTTMNSGYIYFYDAEPIDNYAHNYQYDGTSNPVCYGKGWDNSVDYYTGFANDTQVANVFTAKGPEDLKAIAFCSWDEDMDYTVEIYKNPTEGNPSSGTLMATQSGNVAFTGYYTIPLDTTVPLTTGDTFSVVIKQHVPIADENGAYVHTPYDATFYNSQVVSWCKWTHVDHGPTSYYKEPGGAWTDCPENGDYRIKAFTDDVHFNIQAIANNNAWGSLTVDGVKIIAEPVEGYYVESCEVVSGEATTTININTITVAPNTDCTIRVNFAPKPSYIVNFLASGTVEGQQSALLYDEITLPSSVSISAEGWTFSGWTDTQLAEETTDKPATYYAPGADYMVFGNTTLYAVFTRVEEGAAEIVYELADGLEDGRTYILVAASSISGTTGYAVGNTIVSANHYLTPVSVTINSDNTCTASNANLAKVLWNVSGNESAGYSFYNEAISKYMGLDSSEYLAPSATALRWRYTNSHALDNQIDTEGYYYLSFTSQDTMRYTTSKQESVINLYRASDPDLTYYCTNPIAGEHDHVLQHVEPQPASCTEAGNIEHWRCTICGRCFSDEAGENEITPASAVIIAALGHDYNAVVTEPTCTEAGYTTHTCSRCSDTYTDSETAALGHNFSDWTQTTVPTCTAAGEETRTCSRCNTVETRTVEALGHDYQSTVTSATCTEGGFTTYTCSRCNDTYTGDETEALGHDYTAVVTEPTCTEAGFTTYTCSRCGDSYTEGEIEALGHDWGEGTVIAEPSYQAPGQQTFTCARCGETKTEEIEKLANPFEDVEDEDFFFNPVMWALDETVTGGVDPTHFMPERTVLRSDAMVFFWAANDRPEEEVESNPFKDVSDKHWAHKAVMWAVKNGITGGTKPDQFSPSKTCSRSEILQFLYAAMGKPEYTIENPYSDINTNHWYYAGAIWAFEKGLEKGEEGKFNAATPCTRGYVVTYLYRFFTGNQLAE